MASDLVHSYVFVTETGQSLDLNNIRHRIWEPAQKRAELKYRYPYQARHTFATKSIREGRDPLWIANQMGTSIEMLFKHYAVYFRKKRHVKAPLLRTKRDLTE
jgi:integrase